MTWFNIIKTEDFDEAVSILNRPMKVEEWMKPHLKPHRQEISCCDYVKQKLRLLPDYKHLPDEYVERILDDDCDDVLQLLEDMEQITNNREEGGIQQLNRLISDVEPTTGELDSMIKVSDELLDFWRRCEAELPDKTGIQEETWEEANA
tara:strand:+ start:24454 stop:24900 length:447 start_codon:yes stop_codon:yes gene_type:complete